MKNDKINFVTTSSFQRKVFFIESILVILMSAGNDHEVEFHEIEIAIFHEIEITIMRSKLG